jgi:hypothetical protein
MPKKKSIKKSTQDFSGKVDDILKFLDTVAQEQSDEHVTWLYNYAIIRLYKDFESLMLDAIIGAVNNDTSTLAEATGVKFPQHMTDEVCAYLVIGTGYFDFKGRDGLIKLLRSFVPRDHYLIEIIKNDRYREAINQLSGLRNFAAHESRPSKNAALKAIGGNNLSASGAWLKRQDRFKTLAKSLVSLSKKIESRAPY